MAKQKLIRLYPHGWTNTKSGIDKLNKHLSDGWKVAHITSIKSIDNVETTDYIIEEIKSEKEVNNG